MAVEPNPTTLKSVMQAQGPVEVAAGQQVAVATGGADMASPESSAVVITRLEAAYTTALQAQVTEQLQRDPGVDLFSLDRLNTCSLKLPDNLTAVDVQGIGYTLGTAPLGSLLNGSSPVPSEVNLRAYWKGDTPGLRAPSREDLAQALDRLQKVLAFLKALTSMLVQEEQKYKQELDKLESVRGVDPGLEHKHRLALDAIDNVLRAYDSKPVKERLGQLEAMAGTLSRYLAESGSSGASADENGAPAP